MATLKVMQGMRQGGEVFVVARLDATGRVAEYLTMLSGGRPGLGVRRGEAHEFPSRAAADAAAERYRAGERAAEAERSAPPRF